MDLPKIGVRENKMLIEIRHGGPSLVILDFILKKIWRFVNNIFVPLRQSLPWLGYINPSSLFPGVSLSRYTSSGIFAKYRKALFMNLD